MALYVQTFNFRQPFQVLGESRRGNDNVQQADFPSVSDDILMLPAAQQLDIVKLLSTCVQAEIKPSACPPATSLEEAQLTQQ
jgi:U3 small nucleolar RNA-associated protein 23